MDKFIPDMYYKSIYDINYKKLLKMNIKCIAFDLDNTVASYKEDVPSVEVKELFNLLSDDFKIILFSNASKKRLTPFKEILNVDSSYSTRKPLKKKYLKIMRIYRLKPEEIAFVGDQLITDIYGANNITITKNRGICTRGNRSISIFSCNECNTSKGGWS